MKLEILIIKEDSEIIHKSVSSVDNDANPYSVAIHAIVNELTGHSYKPFVRQIDKLPINYSRELPNYKSEGYAGLAQQSVGIGNSFQKELPLEDVKKAIAKDFGPTKEAPKAFNIQNIPTIKMSDVLKG